MSSQIATWQAKLRWKKGNGVISSIHHHHYWYSFSINGVWVGSPEKERFQPRSDTFGTSFSQSNVIVHVLNSIPHAEILISLKESTTTLYRLWDNQSPNSSSPSSIPKKVFGFARIYWADPGGAEAPRPQWLSHWAQPRTWSNGELNWELFIIW